METTTQQQKKGIGGMAIAITIIILLGIGSGIAYAMTRKPSAGSGGAESELTPEELAEQSNAAASLPKEVRADFRINNTKVTLTEQQKQQIRANPEVKLELSDEQKAQSAAIKTAKMTGGMKSDTGDVGYSSFYNYQK